MPKDKLVRLCHDYGLVASEEEHKQEMADRLVQYANTWHTDSVLFGTTFDLSTRMPLGSTTFHLLLQRPCSIRCRSIRRRARLRGPRPTGGVRDNSSSGSLNHIDCGGVRALSGASQRRPSSTIQLAFTSPDGCRKAPPCEGHNVHLPSAVHGIGIGIGLEVG
ncbi:hypothetical protein B0H10DRAFT_2235258 [Mycena sp. CBHHK59/15]|nr:hypothetical protein B0H10DRAFT_2235258 [Mycena sp. CBHHK59/15]